MTVSGEKIVSGIYFVKCTDKPSTVKKVGSSLIVAPVYDADSNTWKALTDKIDLGSKVEDGDAKVTKKIVDSKFTDSHTTAAFNEGVKFELKATIVGSADEKLNAYAITDTHTKALKFDKVDSVKLVSDTDEKELTEADWERSNATDTGFQIDISKDTVLSTDEFYTYDYVVVDYTATLTEEAVIGNPGNPNSDGLKWKNSSDKEDKRDGNTVYVFTFQIDVNKVDAADKSKKLQGVEFGLYKSEEDAKNDQNGTKAKTDKDGVINYKGLDKGTYYIKETATIKGYNLNTKIYSIEIAPEFSNDELTAPVDGTVSTTIANTASVAPKTGMESTMTFTFIGAGLVLLSAGLFVVAMRKRAK
jgi:LPXTG-motif cell wall-anchored protein